MGASPKHAQRRVSRTFNRAAEPFAQHNITSPAAALNNNCSTLFALLCSRPCRLTFHSARRQAWRPVCRFPSDLVTGTSSSSCICIIALLRCRHAAILSPRTTQCTSSWTAAPPPTACVASAPVPEKLSTGIYLSCLPAPAAATPPTRHQLVRSLSARARSFNVCRRTPSP